MLSSHLQQVAGMGTATSVREIAASGNFPVNISSHVLSTFSKGFRLNNNNNKSEKYIIKVET